MTHIRVTSVRFHNGEVIHELESKSDHLFYNPDYLGVYLAGPHHDEVRNLMKRNESKLRENYRNGISREVYSKAKI